MVRTVVGYHRYDTAAELLLLNEIWQLQSKLTNYFYPQQKLISKVRAGAKVSKKHDTATTPFHRAIDHPTMTDGPHSGMARNLRSDQPRRHPASDPGPDHPAPQNDHQQVPTRHQNPHPQARTIT